MLKRKRRRKMFTITLKVIIMFYLSFAQIPNFIGW